MASIKGGEWGHFYSLKSNQLMLKVSGVTMLALLTLVGYYGRPLALLYALHVAYTPADPRLHPDYTLLNL